MKKELFDSLFMKVSSGTTSPTDTRQNKPKDRLGISVGTFISSARSSEQEVKKHRREETSPSELSNV